MEKSEFEQILREGEGISVEFKEAQTRLPQTLFETICAFLNTKGGKIFLGVRDDSTVIGIERERITQFKRDIANLSNNQKKLDPVFMLSPSEIHYKNKTILFIEVPESSLVHLSKGVVFARNEDGDFQVSRPEAIAGIVNHKQSYFSEQRVFPQISFSDFDSRLFERTKRLTAVRSPAHPWLELTFEELLHRAGFYRKSSDGKEGYTLAAVLCFGKDEIIESIVPAYKIDALVRKSDIDRYDDRLTIRTNLIDAHDMLMQFIAKHLDDPFFLEGDMRVSLREKIFRELVANIIAHREYLDARPATMIIYHNQVVLTNPNNPRHRGEIDPRHFTPFAKNPTISKFMIQIGRVEEIGSGIRNVNKYLPHYAKGGKSEFIEDDMFITNVHWQPLNQVQDEQTYTLPKIQKRPYKKSSEINYWKSSDEQLERYFNSTILNKSSEKIYLNSSDENNQNTLKTNIHRKPPEKSSEKILKLLAKNSNLSAKEISNIIGISDRAVEKQIAKLKANGLIARIGPDKGGYWKVLK